MAIDLKGFSKDRLFGLRNEMVMSRKLVEKRLQPIMKEALERYLGRFIPNFGADWDIVLNEVYPIIQNNLPSIFFRNPKAFLKPRNKTFIAKRRNPATGKMEEVQLDSSKSAKTQEDILNYIISQIGYKGETRKVLLDALLYPFGVMWHGYKGDFGMTDEDSYLIQNDSIFVKRISPLRFLKDPSVSYSELDTAQWVGRSIDVRFNDLVADKQLNFKEKEVKDFLGFGDKVFDPALFGRQGMDTSMLGGSLNSPLSDFADDEFKRSKLSKFVRVTEVYMRPNKEERNKGKRGWVILLADGQKEPLRINEWTIKAEGFPSHLLEFNPVNDREFGLSDVETYASIADQKNVITNLQIRNAQENTKVWVGINKAGANEEDIEKIQQGENTIILFDDDVPVNNRMFVASPGAQASSELFLIDQRIQRNLEDKSGVSDLKRGFLQSGEESATSVKIRAAGSSARPAYRQDIMKDFIQGSLLYINQVNKQFMTVKDAVRVIGSLNLEWSNNPSKEEIQADVDVEIDAISMLPESPEKEMAEIRQAIALIVQAIQDPSIRTKIQQEGKVFNLSPLIEQMLRRLKIMNPEVFQNIDQESSEGFVSAQQLREAQENIIASVAGQEIPHVPKEDDDHRAKIQTYASAAALLQLGGQVSDTLTQLIQIQQQLLAQIESKEARPGNSVNLPGPSIVST